MVVPIRMCIVGITRAPNAGAAIPNPNPMMWWAHMTISDCESELPWTYVRSIIDAGAGHDDVVACMDVFCRHLATLYLSDMSTELDQVQVDAHRDHDMREAAYRMAMWVMFPLHKCYAFMCCKGLCSVALALKAFGGIDGQVSAFAFRMHLLSMRDVDLHTKRRAHDVAVRAELLSDKTVGYRSVDQYVDTQLFKIGLAADQAATILALEPSSPKELYLRRAEMLLLVYPTA